MQSVQRAAGNIHLPVVLPDGTVDPKPSFLFKSSEWSEAYALNKQTSYVFTYDNRALVHIAAERLFHEQGELTFAPNCWRMAKIGREDLDEVRKKLPDTWIAHRLPPDHLAQARQLERMRKQRERFASFLNAFHPRFGPQLVQSWISQFPDADLRDSALAFLEHITYVEPSEIQHQFEEILKGHDQLRQAIWFQLCPMGGKGKSADVLLHDLKELPVPMESFASASAERILAAGHMVFFDDSLNSGVQSSCLLASWFGIDGGCDNPADKDANPLREDIREALRAVDLTFLFYAKHPVGERRLLDTCRNLGLRVSAIHATVDSSRPEFRLDGFRASSSVSTARFVDFLRRRGKALLMQRVEQRVEGWDEGKATDWALGFSGIDLTLVYRHSISASTPVALWLMSSGPVDYWIPAFPRKRTEFLRAINAVPSDRPPVPEYPAR